MTLLHAGGRRAPQAPHLAPRRPMVDRLAEELMGEEGFRGAS